MLKVRVGLAGKLGKCPHCGRQVRIPDPRAFSMAPPLRAPEPVPVAAQTGPKAPRLQGYCYRVDGELVGPVDVSELVSLVRGGTVRKSDRLWSASGDDWVMAGDLPELRQVFAGEKQAVQQTAPTPQPGRDSASEAPVPYGPGMMVAIPATGAIMGMPDSALSGIFGAPSFEYRRYAGFWVRLFAVAIDYLLLLLPAAIVASVVSGMSPDAPGTSPFGVPQPPPAAAMTITLLQVAIAWAYFSLLESSPWQATLGKRALGIFVADILGARITFGRATTRYFLSTASVMVLAACSVFLATVMFHVAKPAIALGFIVVYVAIAVLCAFAGYFLGAFTRKRQTLHDMVAGTVVVYGRRD